MKKFREWRANSIWAEPLLVFFVGLPSVVLLILVTGAIDRYVINPFWPLSLKDMQGRFMLIMVVLISIVTFVATKWHDKIHKQKQEDEE